MAQLSPQEHYDADLTRPGFQADAAQALAVAALQDLFERLVAREAERHRPRARLHRLLGGPPQPEQGLYFWGGVGRGKTFLMDLFYDSLAAVPRRRTHFHRFMQEVHQRLTSLQGASNPLRKD